MTGETATTVPSTANQWPTQPLPHPFTYENGMRPCNAPLYDDALDHPVAYCKAPVSPWKRWRRPAGTHRGDHRITWPNTTSHS